MITYNEVKKAVIKNPAAHKKTKNLISENVQEAIK